MATNTNPKSGWWAAPNPYTDLTWAEFQAQMLGVPRSTAKAARHLLAAGSGSAPGEGGGAGRRLLQAFPAAKDWAALNGTTPVKNQGGECFWRTSLLGAVLARLLCPPSIKPSPSSAPGQPLCAHTHRALTAPLQRPLAGCGSCWAFAGTAGIESKYKISRGVELDLSEQQAVDCVNTATYPSFQCRGCSGGWPQHVLDYATMYPVTTERRYPYV